MNLKATFPVPIRAVVRHNIAWVMSFALLLGFHLALRHAQDAFVSSPDPSPSYWLYTNQYKVLAIVGLILAARLIIGYTVKIAQDYAIEGGRLRVSSGVFKRREALLPLSPSVEFYIHRTFWDLVFGLANVKVTLPGHQESDPATIQGLSLRDAYGLKQTLTEQIDRLQSERLQRSIERQQRKPLKRPRVKRELRRAVVARSRREPIAH